MPQDVELKLCVPPGIRVELSLPLCSRNLIIRHVAKLKKAFSCLSVCMEQLGSHWMNFHQITLVNIFRKSVEKIEVSLKLDKNNGYFT